VSAVGKGRHTTTAALALPLPAERAGGWVVDTPGVRSFGLAHVTADDVPAAFDDLAAAIEDCPRGCGHLGPPADPECALDTLVADGRLRPARLAALRRVLVALR
jgi:ribosome biogenesis GTPase / thiamine phosphate phosphatase